MELNEIPKRNNRRTKAKRVGRGYGSGKGGHTVGKGQKGQKSRTGYGKKVWFEGGNVPLYKRLPKFRGFKRPNRVEYQVLNFADLEKHFKGGEEVSLKSLQEKGLIRKKNDHVKILGKGKLSKNLKYKDVKISNKAQVEIDKLNKK